jgi:type IV secretion system protein VirB9
MTHMTTTLLCAVGLLVSTNGFAQTSRPIVPDASNPDLALAQTPAELQAQIERTNAQMEQLNRSIQAAQVAQGGAVPTGIGVQASAGSSSAGGAGLGSAAPRNVPRSPSSDDVKSLESRLRRARAQRRADGVANDGMITAERAVPLRAKMVFPYVSGSIYEIFTAPDRMTAIELQPGELITSENGKPKAADTVQWVADTVTTGEGAQRHIVVMIKPILSGIETNMLIPTNRHLYSLLLRAETHSYMPLVSFTYPSDDVPERAASTLMNPSIGVAAVPPTGSAAIQEGVGASPESLNFGYRTKGAKQVWTPVRVFDDGRKTYLQMPVDTKVWESPALFVMEERSAPQLVNYRVKGDYYIVDRLFHRAQLRVGIKNFVDIYRDNF